MLSLDKRRHYPFFGESAGRLREIIFRQDCGDRRKYLSAWPLGGILYSEGGLNPLSGFPFPLFSRVSPRKSHPTLRNPAARFSRTSHS